MCKVMENLRNEGAKEAAEQTKLEIAMDMIREFELPLEKIAKYSKLVLEKMKELALQSTEAL